MWDPFKKKEDRDKLLNLICKVWPNSFHNHMASKNTGNLKTY